EGARERVLGLDPAHGVRVVGLLEPAIGVGDLDASVLLHDRVLFRRRVGERAVPRGRVDADAGSESGERERAERDTHFEEDLLGGSRRRAGEAGGQSERRCYREMTRLGSRRTRTGTGTGTAAATCLCTSPLPLPSVADAVGLRTLTAG